MKKQKNCRYKLYELLCGHPPKNNIKKCTDRADGGYQLYVCMDIGHGKCLYKYNLVSIIVGKHKTRYDFDTYFFISYIPNG